MSMRKNEAPDFKDFFREYLGLNYPEIADDEFFIETKNREAVASFHHALEAGRSIDNAYETALGALLRNYVFSKYDFIEDLLYAHFSDRLREFDITVLCRRLIRECESAFSKYDLTDEFMYSRDNRELKEEIVRIIAAKLGDKPAAQG